MVTGTSRPGVMAQVRTKPVQDTMSNVDSVRHEVGCTEIQFVGFHPLKTNLEKDSPYVLLVFAGNQSPHRIRPEIVVQLVDMEKGLVGFPTFT